MSEIWIGLGLAGFGCVVLLWAEWELVAERQRVTRLSMDVEQVNYARKTQNKALDDTERSLQVSKKEHTALKQRYDLLATRYKEDSGKISLLEAWNKELNKAITEQWARLEKNYTRHVNLKHDLERVSKRCIEVEGLLSEEIEKCTEAGVLLHRAEVRHTIELIHECGKPLRTIVRQRYWGWRKRKA